jgi:hypothetical protein
LCEIENRFIENRTIRSFVLVHFEFNPIGVRTKANRPATANNEGGDRAASRVQPADACAATLQHPT